MSYRFEFDNKTLYELDLLECGNVRVTWVDYDKGTNFGAIQRKILKPDELEDGVREFVKAFIDKQ